MARAFNQLTGFAYCYSLQSIHIVSNRPDFYPDYFPACPELFKLSIITGLLVDESKDFVKYFSPSLPFCPLLVSKDYTVNVLSALPVSNELSLVASRHQNRQFSPSTM